VDFRGAFKYNIRMRIFAIALVVSLSACVFRKHDKGVPIRESQMTAAREAKTKSDIVRFLGSPAAVTFVGEEKWFYFHAHGRVWAFTDPKFDTYKIIAVKFDPDENVIDFRESEIAQAAMNFKPDSRRTLSPVEKDAGYIDDLFNNIGRYSLPSGMMGGQ